ncbi:MAG: hypothetical protein QOF28_1580 [Actinomycetota bacterium]|jgi:hypothetical protein|nr:hypothetical protein [Actinomycetota bacterium]
MVLFETGGLVALVLVAFWVWALLDCISTDASLCRNLPKGVWLIVVLLLPDLGSLAWLLLGRPEKAHWRPGSTDYRAPRRPIGIEDDPRYSRPASVTDRKSAELDAELAQWEAQQRPAADPDLDAWEAELNRREVELRRRELELRQRDLDRRESRTDDD